MAQKGEKGPEKPLFSGRKVGFQAVKQLPFPHLNDVPLPTLKRGQKPT
jgi:hypothetical protein